MKSVSTIKINGDWAQGQADSLLRILPAELPDHFDTLNAEKRGDEFDFMSVFSILTHITPPPGMVIDYVYHNFGNAGSPLLYIRGRDDAPCKTAEDISGDGLPFIPPLDGACCDVISGDEVYEQLHSDRTAEGFFEVLLFRIMARNFYLFWHANYNDLLVIGNREGLRSVLQNNNLEENFALQEYTAEEVMALDPTPIVRIGQDSVFVHVLGFSAWSGFVRDSMWMTRSCPHRFLHHRYSVLIPYDCGILF